MAPAVVLEGLSSLAVDLEGLTSLAVDLEGLTSLAVDLVGFLTLAGGIEGESDCRESLTLANRLVGLVWRSVGEVNLTLEVGSVKKGLDSFWPVGVSPNRRSSSWVADDCFLATGEVVGGLVWRREVSSSRSGGDGERTWPNPKL